MFQVGLAEQIWINLSKMFPKKPTIMSEASDSARLFDASCSSQGLASQVTLRMHAAIAVSLP